MKLFHRTGRSILLTDAGKLLQKEARQILEQVALTERGLRELNNMQQGEFKLGSSLTIGNYWLPEKISQFKQQYPGIVVKCTLGNAEEIAEGTAIGLFDLGLVTGQIKASLRGCLEQEIVGSDRLEIVVGKSHPWYQLTEIAPLDLLTTTWVMREPGSGAQQIFEQALQSWEIEPTQLNVVLVLNSSEMVKAVVESGVGAGALPELMVQKELKLSTLHALRIVETKKDSITKLEIVQPVYKLKHQQRFQTRIASAFEAILTQIY